MAPSSPLSRQSRPSRPGFGHAGTSNSFISEESDGFEKPGIYMIVHDGAAVRSGISNNSTTVEVLRRGQKVRIVEIYEYTRQHRVRGRLQSTPGKDERRWISLRDTTDDYSWAKRLGPLQEETEWMKQAKLKRQNGNSHLLVASRRSRTSNSGSASPTASIQEDDPNQHPAYDPTMYDDAEKRLWLECYADGFVKMFCMRSRWSTKEKLVLDVFVERVVDADYKSLFTEDDEADNGLPGSRVRSVKLELPPEICIQALESEVKQRELKDGLVTLCLDELHDVAPQVTLWVWPHPDLDQRWLTPQSTSLGGCRVKYELLLPGQQDEDVYVQARLRWDHWKQQRCFSTMQALDNQRHLSSEDDMPDQKEVRGGCTADRGEWRLGLADR